MKLSVIRGGGRFHALISVAVVAGFAFCAAYAETYTWTGPDNGEWTGANWKNEAGETVVWTDGKDAKFTNTEALTVKVPTAVRAENITRSGSAVALTFTGEGPLSWTGEFTSPALSDKSTSFECPLADVDGKGLSFDVGGICYLRAANKHTGGTYIKNTNKNMGVKAFAINGVPNGMSNTDDRALGPVPKNVQTNVYIQGGPVALFVDSSYDISVNKNRTFLISQGEDFYLSPNGTLRINGNIVGELSSNGYPVDTRIVATDNWSGQTVLSGTNYVGRLFVSGRLEIANGRTQVVTSERGSGINAALFVTGNGQSYYDGENNKRGYMLVSGGTLVNSQDGYRFQTSAYGHLDIAGGLVSLAAAAGSEFLNGHNTPGKITVRDGGRLYCSKFRISQTTAGTGGELFLEKGGTVRVREMWVDFGNKRKGTVHFNGGVLQSSAGSASSPVCVTKDATNDNWEGTDFKVEAGGAIFDTSNGQNLWFGRPLLTGVAEGETDGGLTCRLANRKAVVLYAKTADSTFNGPTRLVATGTGENDRTLQCRVANALPTTATLQIGPGCQAAFSSYAGGSGSQERENADLEQTIARLEGCGKVIYNSKLTVTGAVAPVFDGVYGTLVLEKPCKLNCDYEIAGDANGCSCLELNNSRQNLSGLEPPSIAGLKLKLVDGTTLNKHAAKTTYKILNAQHGFTGKFDESALPSGWTGKYENNAAYLCYEHGLMLIVR